MNFLVNEAPYKESVTDSMINMRASDSERILEESWWFKEKYFQLMLNTPDHIENSKDLFKEVFGDQLICKNYTNRNWIWTFSDNERENTVYALISKTGLSWEYDSTSESKDKVVDVRLAVENFIYNYFMS